MQLVELIPLKPFVGSYKCSLSEADMVDDGLQEKDGVITKVKVPRKRFAGFVPVERAATRDEIDAFRAGKLPGHIEALDEECMQVRVYPESRTVKVPPDIADNLVSRHLAERVVSEQVEPGRVLPAVQPKL